MKLNSTKKQLALATFFAGLVVTHSAPSLAQTDFEQWEQQQQAEFGAFLSAHDQAFLEHLEREWQAFEVFQRPPQDSTPKLAIPPVIRNDSLIHAAILKDGSASNLVTIRERENHYQASSSSFYGHHLEALSFPVMELPKLQRPSNKKVRDTWTTLAREDHSAVLSQILKLKTELQLGDWGLVQLIDRLLKPAFSDLNQRRAYSWFLLNKLGYDARLGTGKRSIVLLLPSSDMLYGVRFTEISGSTYYLLDDQAGEQVHSYPDVANKKHYRQVNQHFNFSFRSLIARTSKTATLTIDYRLDDIPVDIEVTFDAGISEFLADYPQLALHQYFLPHPGQPTAGSLREQLKPLLAERSHREAVDILLSLTQYLFGYQTDQQQFNREKYLLIEESLNYGINDCEDRSIFLAWLTRELLGTELVVLDYPGHVALAVKTEVKPSDDIVEHNNQKYVIVDPTYIGARVGMAMPALHDTAPVIIPIGEMI